ncbi:hypothetical protein HPB50_006890 [Hyalomma asiaticum]|uniref:Uncharacterized protein n=1 Tax=Hyalomma asiaticum TaxID=266040 RepID=A0ACB7RUR4_HYAAI|nr:hypothetical protein HPB50_006890 [Hyalomma asiaticum]
MPKLYVGSLPEGCDVASLEALFAKYGKVEECDIVKNYAFVHMSSEEESKMAIDALHNSEFMGGKITVEASHSKVRPKPGMGGRGQCYRCGRQGHWSKECPRNPNARFGSGMPMMPPGGGPLARYPGVGGPERLGYGSGGPDRFMDRGGAYSDRGFGAAPGYGDRMRPYPDPYERRAAPPPPPSAARDDFYYYRRPYEDFGSSYYGSQDGPSQSYGNGYRFWPTARSEWTGPQDLSAKGQVFVDPNDPNTLHYEGFDPGARFSNLAPPRVPPPPPGVMPNPAQVALMQGHNVVVTQRKANVISGGSSGGVDTGCTLQ